jgi:hypothetical protein
MSLIVSKIDMIPKWYPPSQEEHHESPCHHIRYLDEFDSYPLHVSLFSIYDSLLFNFNTAFMEKHIDKKAVVFRLVPLLDEPIAWIPKRAIEPKMSCNETPLNKECEDAVAGETFYAVDYSTSNNFTLVAKNVSPKKTYSPRRPIRCLPLEPPADGNR